MIARAGAFLLALLSIGTITNAQDLVYLDASAYSRSAGSSSLPSSFGEKVLSESSVRTARAAPAALLVLNMPYEIVRDRLRAQVARCFGEGKFDESTRDDNAEWARFTQNSGDAYDRERRTGFERILKSEDITVDKYREARIETKEYNHRWWRGASSRSVFRVIDGRDVFHMPWTILVIARKDDEIDWGFVHSSVKPFLGHVEKLLVTNREVECAKRDLGANTQVAAFPFFESSLLANANQLVQAKSLLARN